MSCFTGNYLLFQRYNMRQTVHFCSIACFGLLLFGVSYYDVTHRLEQKQTGPSGSGRNQLGFSNVWFGNISAPVSSSNCRPRQVIFLLKTHKCASSTAQNILLRFGRSRELDFVLPRSGNYVGNPRHFRRDFVPPELRPAGGRFDIFAHHTRLNVSEVRNVMKDGAAYVTILRHPVAQFESLFNYYNLKGLYGIELRDFIRLPLNDSRLSARLNGRIGRNQMLWDMGYPPEQFDNLTRVQEFANQMEKFFDLVMIAEHFHTSMIFLSELLCWTLNDVTYFIHNARGRSEMPMLTDDERNDILRLNQGDLLLYNHFLEIFITKVASRNHDVMVQNRHMLHSLINRAYGECYGHRGKSKWENLSELCKGLITTELKFTDNIRREQIKRLSIV